MTPETLAELAAKHERVENHQCGCCEVPESDCAWCDVEWPCDTALLLDALAAEKAALESRVREHHIDHDFLPVAGHPDDDECTYRADGTDATYCGLTAAQHAPCSICEGVKACWGVDMRAARAAEARAAELEAGTVELVARVLAVQHNADPDDTLEEPYTPAWNDYADEARALVPMLGLPAASALTEKGADRG